MASRASKTNTRGYRDPVQGFFASKAEFNRWIWLEGEQAAGRIGLLRRQVGIDITINGSHIGRYRADAVYYVPIPELVPLGWAQVVEDVKGWDGHGTWAFRKKVIEAACGFTILEVPASEWSDRACAKRAKEGAPA